MDEREKTWQGLRAASLSIVTGIGHLYIGEKRGYLLLAIGAALFLISRFLWPPAELFYVMLVIVSAFDAYAIVKRGYGLF
jgi:hypothetical protein